MKIGLVCPYNITKSGGVQECVLALQAGLIRRGHEALILTPEHRNHDGGVLPNTIFVGGSADFHSPLDTTVQISASVDTDEIEEVLEREQFDLIHFHEPWVPMLSRQILSRSRAVNVATFHAKIPETMMSRTVARVVTPYTKSILKYLHALTAVSDAAAEYVRSLTDQNVQLIPNGIDLSLYKPTKVVPLEGDRKVIFYVGRLERRKGLKYLLEAYHLLSVRHDDVSLVIAGDGPERAKLEQLVEDMQLEHVTFTGYLSHEDKLAWLQAADLFCSPAVYGESFGIVLLESMATGTVTVAGNNSGYGAVMQDLGAVSLVDPHHTADFASRLELLLYQEDLRKLWKTWARGYVKQFDYEVVVDQYEQAYKRALELYAE